MVTVVIPVIYGFVAGFPVLVDAGTRDSTRLESRARWKGR